MCVHVCVCVCVCVCAVTEVSCVRRRCVWTSFRHSSLLMIYFLLGVARTTGSTETHTHMHTHTVHTHTHTLCTHTQTHTHTHTVDVELLKRLLCVRVFHHPDNKRCLSVWSAACGLSRSSHAWVCVCVCTECVCVHRVCVCVCAQSVCVCVLRSVKLCI